MARLEPCSIIPVGWSCVLDHRRLPETLPLVKRGGADFVFPSAPDTVLSSAKAPMTVTLVLVGLSAPVPRGRKGKKVKTQSTQPVVQDADWLASCNPDALFQEDSYKKHLKHHCNK